VTPPELTSAQVAEVFQVSEKVVGDWARDDKLPSVWAGRRRRYPAAAVAELAKDRNLPLPDWLVGLAASAPREQP
jgi:hypothetical protein